MDNSLPTEATDWREGRRLRAFELKQQRCSQQPMAEALGLSKLPFSTHQILTLMRGSTSTSNARWSGARNAALDVVPTCVGPLEGCRTALPKGLRRCLLSST
jgi:hypothetical protein